MPIVVDQVQQNKPGEECLMASEAEDGRAAVIFEDDGTTAYFYACETVNGPIFDACHIYDVSDIVDRDRSSEYKIGWSPSGRHAILTINGHPHAVFDFDGKKGWCRTGFPPSNKRWSPDGHAWDDACLGYFR